MKLILQINLHFSCQIDSNSAFCIITFMINSIRATSIHTQNIAILRTLLNGLLKQAFNSITKYETTMEILKEDFQKLLRIAPWQYFKY